MTFVGAKAKGTYLNIDYTQGETWVVRYTGTATWSASPSSNIEPIYYDANGHPGIVGREHYALPGANEGALVGVVGNPGYPFLVGNYKAIHFNDRTGALWVLINDDWTGAYGPGYSDNDGTIEVVAERLSVALDKISDETELIRLATALAQQITAEKVAAISRCLYNLISDLSRGSTAALEGSVPLRTLET